MRKTILRRNNSFELLTINELSPCTLIATDVTVPTPETDFHSTSVADALTRSAFPLLSRYEW
jgi:hypothetical protein